MPFDAAHLRALTVGSADIGGVVTRALILRRVGLIAAGAGSGAQLLSAFHVAAAAGVVAAIGAGAIGI